MNVFLAIILFAALLMTQEVFRRFLRFALCFWAAVPLVLYACWYLLWGQPDWFPWLKVISIEIGILVLLFYRLTSFSKHKTGPWVIYVFLAVNIFEAVFRDIVSASAANYLNAIAGVLLVLTLEKVDSIHVDTKARYRDLSWGGMSLAWILGYTLWNLVFVYINFGPASALMHLAVLAAPLVVAFVNTERWLQARVFTLGTYFVVFHTVPHLNPDRYAADMQTPLGFYAALLSFGFMAVYAISYYRRQSLSTAKVPQFRHRK